MTTTKYGYDRRNTADGWWGERPPRNAARSDIVELNLFDAGHGDPAISFNPILLGLGVTIRLHLNIYARTFKVFISDVEQGVEDVEITDQFEKVQDRVYELRGVIGAGSLNPGARGSADWSSIVNLTIRVEATNITQTSEFNAVLRIIDFVDIRTCPDPCMDDFALLQCLRQSHLHLWRDKIKPTRQPGDTPLEKLFFFFEQSDALVTVAPCICDCFNYYSLVMVGVKFFVVGSCEDAALREYPEQAGCNPWQEEVPGTEDAPCVLPFAWELSTCSPP